MKEGGREKTEEKEKEMGEMGERRDREESEKRRERKKSWSKDRESRGSSFSGNASYMDGCANSLQNGPKVTLQETLLKVSGQPAQDLDSFQPLGSLCSLSTDISADQKSCKR